MEDQQVQIKIPPPGKVIFNSLWIEDPPDLSCDLVGVSLPDEHVIDVSWHPENDPKGCYIVTLFKEYWDCKIKEARTTDIYEAGRLVETFAKEVLEK